MKKGNFLKLKHFVKRTGITIVCVSLFASTCLIANAEEKIHTAIYFTNLFENVDSIIDGGQIIINERKAFLGIGYKHTYSHA